MNETGGAWNTIIVGAKVIGVLTLAFFGSASIAAIVQVATESGEATASVKEREAQTTIADNQRTRETIWNEQSKDAVRSRLKDGSSAKFRNVRFSDASGTPVTCGQVNAKNGLGGYRGFQGFVAGGPDRSLVFLEEQVGGFASVRRELCGR